MVDEEGRGGDREIIHNHNSTNIKLGLNYEQDRVAFDWHFLPQTKNYDIRGMGIITILGDMLTGLLGYMEGNYLVWNY